MGILSGKVALVTGGRRGIGRGVSLALAAEGADVAVNDVEGAEQAEAVAQDVRDLGRRAVVVMADVAQPDQVQGMVDGVVSELGGWIFWSTMPGWSRSCPSWRLRRRSGNV